MSDLTGNGRPAWPSAPAGSSPAAVAVKTEPAPKRVIGTLGFALDAVLRRRSGRIALRALVAALALGGIALLAYPLITNFWADRIQNKLEQQYEAVPAEGFKSEEVREGGALTRLRIPKLKVNKIVVEGTSGKALQAGLGHFRGTALPGDPGNVAIAGHRTGFGEPLRNVHLLKPGDRIEMYTPLSKDPFVYEVVPPFEGHDNPWITHASDMAVIGNTSEPSLTLVTCDPPGTSKNRLIVRARLIRSPG